MRSKKIYLSLFLALTIFTASAVSSAASAALPASGTWFSYNLINYNGKTFQKHRTSEAGNAIFYPTNEIDSSTRPECTAEDGARISPATIELSVPGNGEPGDSATVRTYQRGEVSCGVKNEKSITLKKSDRRNKLFILNTDNDTITTWNNRDHNIFEKVDRAEFTQGYGSKPGWDIYRQGASDSPCQDTIVKNPDGIWYVLPMQDSPDSFNGQWGWEANANSEFYASLFVDDSSDAHIQSSYYKDCSLGGHKLVYGDQAQALGYGLDENTVHGETFEEGKFRHKDTCGDDDNNFEQNEIHRIDSSEFDNEIEGWDDGNTDDSASEKNKYAPGGLKDALIYIKDCSDSDSHSRVYYVRLNPYDTSEIQSRIYAQKSFAISSAPGLRLDSTVYIMDNGVASLTQNEIDGTDDAQDTNVPPPEPDDTDCGGEDCEEGVQCAIEKVGWIVCPAMEFLAGVTDRAFTFLADAFLSTDAELVKTGGGTYFAWQIMRDFANAAFVIAFLIIIYSQLTSAGISNYGIKKMMPKLIIAAVLVNASFIICQLAVDLTNIIGYSLKGFLDAIAADVAATSAAPANSGWASGGGAFSFAGITVLILAAGALVLVLLPLLGTILLTALITLVTIVIILLLRKALIILLIFVSPLAFVAYLLPNTEKLFEKWKDMFIKLLMVFPIVALLFGAGNLAAQVILRAGGDYSSGESGDAASMTLGLVAAGVAIAPLLAVWGVLQGALAAAGAIGGKIAAGTNKVGRFGGEKASGVYKNSAYARGREIRKSGKAKYKDEKFASALNDPQNPWQRMRGRAARGVAVTAGGRAGQEHLGTAAFAAANKADNEEVGHISDKALSDASKSGMEIAAYLQKELEDAFEKGESARARGIMTALKSQKGGVEAIQASMESAQGQGHFDKPENETMSNDVRTHINANRASYDSKDARVSQWARTSAATSDSAQIDAALTQTDISGLTHEQIATQSAGSLTSAPGLTKEVAKAVLKNPSATAEAKEGSLAVLRAKAK